MSDENINDDYFCSTQPLRPQTHKIPTGKSNKSMLTPLNVNINISPQTKLLPLYSTPSRYNSTHTPSTSKGHRYMTRENSFTSAPPPTADSAFERPWTSTAAVNATATRSEFRRPLTSKPTEVRNAREGKKVETSAVVLVGDSGCGKTSLIMTYLHKRFTLPSKSILFETYDKVINFNNVDTSIKLQIWDFPGDEYFDRFRPLGYANAQGILLCFAIDNVDSFNNIKERWIPEINTHCPKVFKIMIGIGFEVRRDKTKRANIPSYDQCYKFAKNHGYKYMESSFVDQRSCALAFEQISLWAIDDLTKNNRASKIPGTSSSTLGYHIKKTRPNTSYNKDIVYHGPPPEVQELSQHTQRLNSQDEDVINEEDEKELDTHYGESNEAEEEEGEVTLKRVSSYRRYKGVSKCAMM